MEKETEFHNEVEKKEEEVKDIIVDVEETREETLPEFSSGEDAPHEEEEHSTPDYSNFSKAELVKMVEDLLKENNIRNADKVLKEVKPFVDEIQENERKEALEKFKSERGTEDDFAYKYDEVDNKFEAAVKQIREKKANYFSNLEKQKEQNLVAKNELLEKLRGLVDADETFTSINVIKDIQKEWKSIGQVPAQFAKSLWANYNALVDRFYDNRSIYFELKELDRKKNLEAKLQLCEKAEKLEELTNLKEAIKDLNDLHEEFKHIGPVPADEQENVWQRFKTASDKVYSRRKDFIDQLKKDLYANLEVKKELCDAVQEFGSFNSDRINDWNKKTRELLDIQKKWEETGGIPREEAKEINRRFWTPFKTFFNNKNNFFKKLSQHREENLQKKEELIKRAEELKESREWDKTANQLKQLQVEWKNVGPVPEKYKNEIYDRFKAACDHFFEQKRNKNSETEQEFVENLKKKEAICTEIEALAASSSSDVDALQSLYDQWNEIGFVPRNDIKRIQKKFEDAVEKFFENASELDDESKSRIRFAVQFNSIKNKPFADKKINKKENALRRQIIELENNINTWNTNLDFFANSKSANKLKDEFMQKIEEANEELRNLKEQLNVLKNM